MNINYTLPFLEVYTLIQDTGINIRIKDLRITINN